MLTYGANVRNGARGCFEKMSGGPIVTARYRRITIKMEQMGGVPCIRGLRIPVATVVGMIADGMTADEILESYPDLRREDIAEALRNAADAVRERELPIEATA